MWESVLQVNTAKSIHTVLPALAVGMENLVVAQAQPLIVQVVVAAVASIMQRQVAAVVQQTVMVVLSGFDRVASSARTLDSRWCLHRQSGFDRVASSARTRTAK